MGVSTGPRNQTFEPEFSIATQLAQYLVNEAALFVDCEPGSALGAGARQTGCGATLGAPPA